MQSTSRDFMIDLRRLRVLEELADRGTITATAAALHLTPSAVSQQIAVLARDTRVPLLRRQGRGVQLTPQARLLLAHGTVLRAQLEQTRADLEAHATSEVSAVSLGAFASAISGIVAPASRVLREQYPRLELAIRQTQPPTCFTQLNTEELDLVITVDWRNAPHRDDQRYERNELFADPFLVALPADHPLTCRETLTLSDLATESWIGGDEGGPCLEVMLTACAASGFRPKIVHRTEDWHATTALVAVGAGVALIPGLAISDASHGITIRPLTENPPTRTLVVLSRAGTSSSPHVRTVIEALIERGTVVASAVRARFH